MPGHHQRKGTWCSDHGCFRRRGFGLLRIPFGAPPDSRRMDLRGFRTGSETLPLGTSRSRLPTRSVRAFQWPLRIRTRRARTLGSQSRGGHSRRRPRSCRQCGRVVPFRGWKGESPRWFLPKEACFRFQSVERRAWSKGRRCGLPLRLPPEKGRALSAPLSRLADEVMPMALLPDEKECKRSRP
jgi:hypothetical protein